MHFTGLSVLVLVFVVLTGADGNRFGLVPVLRRPPGRYRYYMCLQLCKYVSRIKKIGEGGGKKHRRPHRVKESTADGAGHNVPWHAVPLMHICSRAGSGTDGSCAFFQRA